MDEFQTWLQIAILLATIAAIIYGPIRAVQVTRQMDEQRETRDRRYRILSDLMQTRRARIDPVHFGALNLVELVFYGRQPVVDAYKAYTRHLNSEFPQSNDAIDRHIVSGDDLFANLLFHMASDLNFTFDKLDLSRQGYFPTGLGDYNNNSMINSLLLREVLEGKRPIPISNFVMDREIFPPPPAKTSE